MDCRDVGYLADFIAQNIALRHTDKQEILEEMAPFVRLRKLNGFLARECNVLSFEHEMEGKVRDQLARSQRDQILRTQIRVLQNELGEGEDVDDEIDSYREKILALGLEEDTEKQLLLGALAQLSPREQRIMRLRFGLGGGREMTQKEVADVLGISQSYISRLEKRILSRLHTEMMRISS